MGRKREERESERERKNCFVFFFSLFPSFHPLISFFFSFSFNLQKKKLSKESTPAALNAGREGALKELGEGGEPFLELLVFFESPLQP